jgi:YD repeat-containing protein
VASFSHAYDIRGNLASLAELSGTKRYAYDQIERLTAVTQQQGAGPATPAEAYTYDAEGNRVTCQVFGQAVRVTSLPPARRCRAPRS